MSKGADLDWLARNVHAWPERKTYVQVSRDVYFYASKPQFGKSFTREQWLARRAELQNKPSWKDAPEWANWIAQSPTDGDSGIWCFFAGEPTDEVNGIWSCSVGKALTGRSGLILGDWRDTLERRPEEFKPSIEEANRLAQDFKPFTSIEDNQEQEMKQDNGWFERGELPPDGAECEIHHQQWIDGKFERVQIAAITREYVIVDDGKFEQHYLRKDMSFLPVRTEREKAMEEMLKDSGALECQTVMSIIENLLDKGWHKEKK